MSELPVPLFPVGHPASQGLTTMEQKMLAQLTRIGDLLEEMRDARKPATQAGNQGKKAK